MLVIARVGRRQPVAVLFSDLRGFTGYAERVPPEQLIAELNRYLDAMVAAIRREGGVVDKFMGDAIMVVFGIPSLRIKGFYLAVATLAAQFFLVWLFNRVPWFYNYSASGQITAPERTTFGVPAQQI